MLGGARACELAQLRADPLGLGVRKDDSRNVVRQTSIASAQDAASRCNPGSSFFTPRNLPRCSGPRCDADARFRRRSRGHSHLSLLRVAARVCNLPTAQSRATRGSHHGCTGTPSFPSVCWRGLVRLDCCGADSPVRQFSVGRRRIHRSHRLRNLLLHFRGRESCGAYSVTSSQTLGSRNVNDAMQ
jgi:hypothetical protein